MSGEIAVTRREAARRLGLSLSSFERHCQPQIKLIRLGRMRLVPVRELERWVQANAAFTLERER